MFKGSFLLAVNRPKEQFGAVDIFPLAYFPANEKPPFANGGLAEQAERRKDSKVAREWELALPDELPHGERVALARDFAKALVERYGVIVDVCIHAPGKGGDQRNHHAHLLTTTRKYTPEGLKEKTEILDSPKTSGKEVDAVRAIWERLCNDMFQHAGIPCH